MDVVLHFQSPYATAVACMKEIPRNFNVTAEVPCHVGSEIPVIPYFRPGSPELAEQVKAALKDHNSCLLRKHGQVVCGKDFDQAFERAMFFEMACRIIVLSGGRYEVLSQEEIDDLETYILGKAGSWDWTNCIASPTGKYGWADMCTGTSLPCSRR